MEFKSEKVNLTSIAGGASAMDGITEGIAAWLRDPANIISSPNDARALLLPDDLPVKPQGMSRRINGVADTIKYRLGVVKFDRANNRVIVQNFGPKTPAKAEEPKPTPTKMEAAKK